jgi:hypothetical protein
MKPWEETWAAVSAKQTGGSNELHWGEGQVSCLPWGHIDDDLAACRLAAAAPEMARLLLDLEHHHGECGTCFEDFRSHAPDCKWVAVLRKAGVLP